MASGSLVFYSAGGILLALAFMAHVAHAALLANGRRSIALFAPRTTPAFAGVVSGSFAETRSATPATDVRSAAGPFAFGLTVAAALSLGLSMALRAAVVQRGQWGN